LAIATLSEQLEAVTISLDEATREVPGAPNIPKTIVEKIDSCDIFVADVTLASTSVARAYPNPNVTFELGYAVSQIGWNRILMLSNKTISGDSAFPFDFDRHRIESYNLALEDKNRSIEIKKLSGYFVTAIRQIIQKNPEKPNKSISFDVIRVKRERDLKNAIWVLETLWLPGVQDFISRLPDYILDRHVVMFEAFRGVFESPVFHINDDMLRGAFDSFAAAWKRCFAHSELYKSIRNASKLEYNIFIDSERLKVAEITSARDVMHVSFQELLTVIRERFVEIDLDKTNASAYSRIKESAEDIESSKV